MKRRTLLKDIGTATIIGAIDPTTSGIGRGSPDSNPEDWPTWQYDMGHSGHNPDAKGPVGNVSIRWRTEAPLENRSRSSNPPVVDGLVFDGTTRGTIIAYDADDGSTVWEFGTGDNIVPPKPTVHEGVVYQGNGPGETLFALDAESGTLEWKYQPGDPAVAPYIVTGDLLYFAVNQTLHAVNVDDGTAAWRYEPGGQELLPRTCITDGTKVYVAESTFPFAVHALDSSTGDVVWTREFSTNVLQTSITGGVLFVGGHNYVSAHNPADGSELWQFDFRGSVSSLSIDDRHVFFGTNRETMYGINRETGEERWQFEVGPTPFGSIPSAPSVVQNLVYFGSYDTNVYALNARTGREIWSLNTGRAITGSPSVGGRRLYVGTRRHGLVAIG